MRGASESVTKFKCKGRKFFSYIDAFQVKHGGACFLLPKAFELVYSCFLNVSYSNEMHTRIQKLATIGFWSGAATAGAIAKSPKTSQGKSINMYRKFQKPKSIGCRDEFLGDGAATADVVGRSRKTSRSKFMKMHRKFQKPRSIGCRDMNFWGGRGSNR